MAKFTINKFISTIFYFLMLFLFFIWLLEQTEDFALLLGFRLSDVVANDIGDLITIVGGVSGDVEVKYIFSGKPQDGKYPVLYDVTIGDKIVCVKSTWPTSQPVKTLDCSSAAFDTNELKATGLGNDEFDIPLKITKTKDLQINLDILEIPGEK